MPENCFLIAGEENVAVVSERKHDVMRIGCVEAKTAEALPELIYVVCGIGAPAAHFFIPVRVKADMNFVLNIWNLIDRFV